MSHVSLNADWYDVDELALLEVVRKHWYEIVNYLTLALYAENEAEQSEIESNIVFLHEHLNSILHILHLSKKKLFASLTCENKNINYSQHNDNIDLANKSRNEVYCNNYNRYYNVLINNVWYLSSLPLCYIYLFFTSSYESERHLVSATEGNNETYDKELSRIDQMEVKSDKTDRFTVAMSEKLSHIDLPSPIGATFLLTLCMFAKSNQPKGARNAILKFLCHVIYHADLIINENNSLLNQEFISSNNNDTVSQAAHRKAMSMFMLNPAATIVPLLDALRKIGRELFCSIHPQIRETSIIQQHQQHNTNNVHEYNTWNTDNAFREIRELEHKELFITHSVETYLEYLKFVNAIIWRVRQVPMLANYFINETTDFDCHSHSHSHYYEERGKLKENKEHNTRFELLDILILYLSHNFITLDKQRARDIYRLTFHAILTLAECSDREVQKFVSNAESEIFIHTLNAMRTTLLTLCKIPHNEDSAYQMEYLIDTIRWWFCFESLVTSQSTNSNGEFYINELIHQTIFPLFESVNTHAYTAVSLVVSRLLWNLQEASCNHICKVISQTLLFTWVCQENGTLITSFGNSFKPFSSMSPVEPSWTSELLSLKASTESGYDNNTNSNNINNKKKKSSVHLNNVNVTTSRFNNLLRKNNTSFEFINRSAEWQHLSGKMILFLNFYSIPHLTPTPVISEEQIVNSEALSFELDRWSAAKATLMLIKMLIEHNPYLFQQYLTCDEYQHEQDASIKHLEEQKEYTDASAKYENKKSQFLYEAELSREYNLYKGDQHREEEYYHSEHSSIQQCFSTAIISLIEELSSSSSSFSSSIFGISKEAKDEEIMKTVLQYSQNNVQADVTVPYKNFWELDLSPLWSRSSFEESQPLPRSEITLSSPITREDRKKELLSKESMQNLSLEQATQNKNKKTTCDTHKALKNSPLINAVSDMLKEFIYLPKSVRMMLSSVIRELCLLPDANIYKVLLDVEHGCFYNALTTLRAVIDRELDTDVKYVTELLPSTEKHQYDWQEEHRHHRNLEYQDINNDQSVAFTRQKNIAIGTGNQESSLLPPSAPSERDVQHKPHRKSYFTSPEWIWSHFWTQPKKSSSSSSSLELSSSITAKEHSLKHTSLREKSNKLSEHFSNQNEEKEITEENPCTRKRRDLWFIYAKELNSREDAYSYKKADLEDCTEEKKSSFDIRCSVKGNSNVKLSLSDEDIHLFEALVDVTLLSIDFFAITRYIILSNLLDTLHVIK